MSLLSCSFPPTVYVKALKQRRKELLYHFITCKCNERGEICASWKREARVVCIWWVLFMLGFRFRLVSHTDAFDIVLTETMVSKTTICQLNSLEEGSDVQYQEEFLQSFIQNFFLFLYPEKCLMDFSCFWITSDWRCCLFIYPPPL